MAVTESGHLASREIDELYRAHFAEVYRYAFAVLGNRADAEDVMQTTFLNAYRALEQGVRPRKPSNWLLTIASNAIKQRFRQEQSRPRQVELDDRIADTDTGSEDEDSPSVGELLTALSKIPPQQRQAIVLREFEGRSYAEIAEILGVTTSALETLLFRARRSLTEELQHQLTCTEAQLAVSRSVDGRLGRKERRRLRDHLTECPDCAGFARLQQRHRSALRGLALVPIPLSLTVFKGLEGTASAALLPISAGGAVGAAAVGTTAAGSTGGILAGGLGMKAAAVVAAASVAGGVGVAGSSEIDTKPANPGKPIAQQQGQRLGQVAPRGVLVPGNGVAVGRASAPGQAKTQAALRRANAAKAKAQATARAAKAKEAARGQSVRAEKRAAAARKKAASAKSTAAPKPTPPASNPKLAQTPNTQRQTGTPKAGGPQKGQQAGPGQTASAPASDKAGGPKER
ncbi:MAG TPA: sigma-70 family RNA polymerase sigma factor [Gaiellaceae bacterium]|nr:sigma-70 family RNA polymerase sigma factor [Gaiellaceae bacterium]